MAARKKPPATPPAPPAGPRLADKIVPRAIADLVPYANNARTHSKRQVQQIAASIKEFGFTNPVLVDAAGGIVAGHGRVLGAQLLKMPQVPTIDVGYLTEAQRKAYVLADNKLALNAGWDVELLGVELGGILELGIDSELVGFSAKEVERITGKSDGLDPDDMQDSFEILVECTDEPQQRALLERLAGEGYKCKSLLR
jgi:ParB-like chromosome segregation protein Spo0J